MKTLVKPISFKMVIMLLVGTFIQAAIWAQDGGSSTTTTTTHVSNISDQGSNWYASPWVWVVGGAVFIILLIALTRGGKSANSSTDRVTVTKTVSRDNDTV